MLYRIIKKNQNKIFWTIGQFEFEYFGGSDVADKLFIFSYLEHIGVCYDFGDDPKDWIWVLKVEAL